MNNTCKNVLGCVWVNELIKNLLNECFYCAIIYVCYFHKLSWKGAKNQLTNIS